MDSFFVYYLQLLFSLLNNPLFAPYIIHALNNPVSPLMFYLPLLLQEPHQPIDNLPWLLLHFCQGKPGQGLQ